MHQIENFDKQQGLQQAWHGLTQIVPDLSLDNNWLRDWDVEPTPLFYGDGREHPCKQLVCTDDRKITVGMPYNPASFRPISNREFLQMISDAISGTDHKLVSVGSVRNRGRVFVSFELVDLGKYEAGGRKFSPFLNFGHGNDKSSILWINSSNICVVCDNTFSMNLYSVESKESAGNDLNVKTRHTKNVHLKLPELAKVVDRAVGVQAEFAAAFESFSERSCKPERAERIFTGFLVPPDAEKVSTRARNTVDELVTLFKRGKGNHGDDFSDLFSAATDYYTHSSSSDNRQKQFLSSEYGSGAQKKVDFFHLLQNGERLEKVEARGAALLAL